MKCLTLYMIKVTVLCCVALCCIVLHCIALYGMVLYQMVLYCIGLYCIVDHNVKIFSVACVFVEEFDFTEFSY